MRSNGATVWKNDGCGIEVEVRNTPVVTSLPNPSPVDTIPVQDLELFTATKRPQYFYLVKGSPQVSNPGIDLLNKLIFYFSGNSKKVAPASNVVVPSMNRGG